MATISIKRPQLFGYDPGDTPAVAVQVNGSGTAFTRNDIVTVGTSGAAKLTAGGAAAVKMALALEDSSDPYTEPIVGTAQGASTTQKQLLQFGGDARVIMNTLGALSQANIGVNYALAYNNTAALGDSTMVVDQGTTANAAVTILGVADPEFGGGIGDTSPRVIVKFLAGSAF